MIFFSFLKGNALEEVEPSYVHISVNYGDRKEDCKRSVKRIIKEKAFCGNMTWQNTLVFQQPTFRAGLASLEI